ncbi:unnamed protein product [Cunninghamella echinulata]
MNRATSGRDRFGVAPSIQNSAPKPPSTPFGPIDSKIDDYTFKQLIKSANTQAQSVSYGYFTSPTSSIKYNNLLIPSIPRK